MTELLKLPDWHDEFVLARDARKDGRSAELLSAVRHGILAPVGRGVYRYVLRSGGRDCPLHDDAVPENTVHDNAVHGYAAHGCATHSHAPYNSAARGHAVSDREVVAHHAALDYNGRDDAFVAKVRATQILSPEPLVYAGFAAAAIWGLPIVGNWPDIVDVAAPVSPGGRSNKTLRRSNLFAADEWEVRDGLRVTSLARTIVDIGRTAPFLTAVTMADAALAGQRTTAESLGRKAISAMDLKSQLRLVGSARGSARCTGVLNFADGASALPGESVSRVNIHLLGLPAPELQVTFVDHLGFIGTVDYWWPHLRLIGEFDGSGKYLRDQYTHGRGTADIVLDEKYRENRLRALGASFTRWGWTTAMSLSLLRQHLVAAGLR